MKVTLQQQHLNLALSFLQKAVPTKPQLPILASVLVKTHEVGVDVSATDMYFGVKTTIPFATIKESGEIVVPGKLFRETIHSLPNGEIVLEKVEQKLLMKAKNIKTSMPTQPSDEYPAFPDVQGFTLELTATQILAIEKLLSFSTSTDVARPVLTALLFRLKSEGLTVVATDGFRLSVLSFAEITSLEEKEFLIPSQAFSEVTRIMNANSAEKAEFTISQEAKQVVCRFSQVEIYIRLIEGAYPPYERIIPSLFTTEAVLSAEELAEQVKRALIFARDASNIITISFTLDEVSISAISPISGTYQGILEEATVTGTESKISFNARYLLDYLQAIKTGTIWFGMNDSLKPALFKHTEMPEHQYIIMPFKVNS